MKSPQISFPNSIQISQKETWYKEPQAPNHQPGESAFLNVENMIKLHQNKWCTAAFTCLHCALKHFQTTWARSSPAVYTDPKNSMSFISFSVAFSVGKRREGGTKMGHINSITRYLCTNLNGIWIRQQISCTAFVKKIMLSSYTENTKS